MKNKFLRPTLICLWASMFLSTSLYAHCPASIKEDKVCLMLDANTLYIYDEKLEHNGPYKDLQKTEVIGFKSDKGAKVDFKKLARGIYKLNTTEKLNTVTMTVSADKKQKDIKIKHE